MPAYEAPNAPAPRIETLLIGFVFRKSPYSHTLFENVRCLFFQNNKWIILREALNQRRVAKKLSLPSAPETIKSNVP